MARTLTEAIGVPKPAGARSFPVQGGRGISSPGLRRSIEMKERKTLFRRVFESMIEGRTQQAQRYITEYLKTHPADSERRD